MKLLVLYVIGMYGRGTRLLTQPALSTAPAVGPGTYRVDNGGKHIGGWLRLYTFTCTHVMVQLIKFMHSRKNISM